MCFPLHPGTSQDPPALLSLAACPAGTFKASQGSGLCVPCPPNSRSSAEASPVCPCRNGYYRADFDPPAAACTSEYGIGLQGLAPLPPGAAAGIKSPSMWSLFYFLPLSHCGCEQERGWAGKAEGWDGPTSHLTGSLRNLYITWAAAVMAGR